MKTANSARKNTEYGARIIAFLLLAGGLLGLMGSLLAVYRCAQQQLVVAGMSGIVSTLLFGWCILTGPALWRTTDTGFKWAKLLFAMQVPVFSIARISYEFSTFLSLRVMIGNTTHHIGGNVGSSSNLNLLPQSPGFLFGINILAVLIFLYLIWASRVRFSNVSTGSTTQEMPIATKNSVALR